MKTTPRPTLPEPVVLKMNNITVMTLQDNSADASGEPTSNSSTAILNDRDLSPWFVYPVISIYILVWVVCFLGNIPIILAIFRFRQFHRPTYYFLASNAMADIVLCLSFPLEILILLNQSWLEEYVICALLAFSPYCLLYPSSLSTLFTAFCRYVQVVHSKRLKYFKHKCFLIGIMSYTWLVGIVIVLGRMINSQPSSYFVKDYGRCAISYNDILARVGKGIVGYPAPIAMIYFYAHIYWKHRQSKKRIRNGNSPTRHATNKKNKTEASTERLGTIHGPSNKLAGERVLTLSALSICLVYCGCTLIHGILSSVVVYLQAYGTEIVHSSSLVLNMCPLFNVVIIFVLNSNLRQCSHSVLTACCRRNRVNVIV